jgi:hypothetical protein
VGAHTRESGRHVKTSGRHRGEAAPLFEIDLTKLGATTGVLVAAAGTAVALAPAASAATATPHAAAAQTATANDFARLRNCESGGRYATNTGNGYYGAYQFDLRTWQGLGYGGLPSSAAPAVQDQAAERLEAARGWSPWPACSAKLGLGSHTATSVPVAAAAPFKGVAVGRGFNPFAPRLAARTNVSAKVTAQPVAVTQVAAPVVPTTPPAFDSQTALDPTLVGTERPDVKLWQQRMHDRGWPLTVDGYFGRQSADAAAAFAQEKGIASGALGAVGQAMWNAAWQLPVT